MTKAYKRLATVYVAVAFLFVQGCARHATPKVTLEVASNAPGTLASVTHLKGYSATTLRLMLWWADLPEHIPVRHGVDLYRIEYWTTNYDGAPVLASGLVSFPRKEPPAYVLSYQHGTNPTRALTPSRPSLEGVLGSAVFASGGYLFVAPDYVGLGTSKEMHPYFNTKSTVASIVDCLRAAHACCDAMKVKWPDEICLAGFSQGGHATIAVHKELERLNDPALKLIASAPVAPPCNLDTTSFPFALENHGTFYLAYMTNAYCRVYGHPIESMLAAPYAESVPKLFDGVHKPEDIEAALPKNARELFTKEFLDTYDTKQPTWLLTAIAENDVEPWPCKAPMRVYYGSKDMDVSPVEGPNYIAKMTGLGANASVVCVGAYDHNESVVHALPYIRDWFDDFDKLVFNWDPDKALHATPDKSLLVRAVRPAYSPL